MSMEAAFFKNVDYININNAQFVQHNGADNSQKTIHHHAATTINDRSRHLTKYGRYLNFGQHAEGEGQINNYGAQTTNNGPIHGFQQYIPNKPHYPERNKWPRSSYNDDNFDDGFQDPVQNESYPYQPQMQPDRLHPGDRDYFGRSQSSQSDSRLGNNRPKEPIFPRSKTAMPNRPTKEFDVTSPQFMDEYAKMSPLLKDHLRELGFDPRKESLSDRMANVSLDDQGLQRSHSPGSFGRRTPEIIPRKGKHFARHSASDDDDDDEEEEDEEHYGPDYDSANGQRLYSSYTHNDNRVITKHINSHNVNTENVVDSYNDNSTRTDINKNSAR